MKLIVKNNVGETVSIQIKSNETFMDLKERVEEEAGISLDLKDIALKGKKITENQRVMEYFLSYNEVEEEPLMNIHCAVPGCTNTKVSNVDKVFFEFPTEEIRCHQWVLYCQRLNAGPGKKRLSLTSESTICSDHFRTDQFVKNTQTLLKRTAVPSVKMTPSRLALPSLSKSQENLTLEVGEAKNYFSEESQDTKEDILQLRLCRLCSNACNEFIMIFDDYGKELKIAEKINLCLPVEINMTDGLPKQICRECLNQVDQLYELADMVSLAQLNLKHLNDTSSDDLALVDETGEEVILGTSASDLSTDGKQFNSCCPLCKEGKIIVSSNKKNIDVNDSSDGLPTYSEMDCDNFVNISGSLNKKKIINSQGMYDTELESQVDCSSEDFTKENVLKLDDSSKSDNDQISECYSSLTSPLNIASEDSCLKSIRENPLSPITEEFGQDAYLDSESEYSINHPSASEASCSVMRNTISCRMCGFECNSNTLLKHSLCHSFNTFYQCVACVIIFSDKEDLVSHISNHEDEDLAIVYCEVCSKAFNSAVSLASHVCNQEETVTIKHRKKHTKTDCQNETAFCNICNKIFPDEMKFQKHCMYIHNNKKAYCCDECGKVFKSEASMNYHQRTHQTDDSVRPYTCERCGKSFIRKSMLMNHMTSSHKHVTHETPCFTCKLCYEAFPSTAAAVYHMDNHHKLDCLDSYSFEMHTINRLFICEFCDRCYAEGNVLNQHRELHPSDSPYECRYCGSTFTTLDEILHHRNEHANIPSEYLSKFSIPRTYLCEYCERYFLNQVKYTEHLTVHYGPEPYQCRHCTLKFPSLSEAVEHRVNHGDSGSTNDDYNFYRPYECHYCSKTFAIEDALVKHIRMHTGEKPFICDQCGKGFSQSSGLYTHQKVHSSERPYSCSVCPRKFKIKGDRDVHVRKHSGDRPYKCEFCGKAFMTQHVYSQHRKIHTGERPYKCDVCGIAFRRSHVLTVHKRIHTGEKPNICEICGKRYRQKGDMLKHRRIQHGIVSTKPMDLLL